MSFGVVRRYAGRLRFPYLLALTTVLLGIDLAVPDVLPLLDELVLALLAVTFASLKKKRVDSATPGRRVGETGGS